MGLIALILPGVRPIIARACSPTATTSPVATFFATTEGSLKTIPLPST